ncbi:hypothetical protein BXY82_2307 [Gelidibacter sediminis]|uniref:Uncharacterized protein n=1 Tax=Gelidibacter sediminis TaxID=1608710 RepID=A0A4R7Q1D5_9FLAO|nr:DUF5362 family protein [Gelidibacter sediminis]TDU40260.1 hypothetical protein BXY82_2307 [Gelidibacter sediminis]
MIAEKSAFDTFELNLPPAIFGFLKETSSWTYFLSILGFIGIGLMLLFGIFFSVAMGLMPGGNPYESMGMTMNMSFVGIFYAVMAVCYFFPVLYLFNFSRKMKSALNAKNNDDLTAAFANLKSHYKFLGIFTIAIVGLYILLLIGAMVMGLA